MGAFQILRFTFEIFEALSRQMSEQHSTAFLLRVGDDCSSGYGRVVGDDDDTPLTFLFIQGCLLEIDAGFYFWGDDLVDLEMMEARGVGSSFGGEILFDVY